MENYCYVLLFRYATNHSGAAITESYLLACGSSVRVLYGLMLWVQLSMEMGSERRRPRIHSGILMALAFG